jgi:hypothetical protein
MLRRIFGLKKENKQEGGRKLHNKGLHNMRWHGHGI